MGKLIYAVEDESAIRELYSFAIGNAGNTVVCFERGNDMFASLKNSIPELIILDIMLDGQDGFEILSQLKKTPEYSDIPVIMVSAKGEELIKVKGLNMGAADYISKPFGVLELLARINANLRKTVRSEKFEYKDIIIDDSVHSFKVCGGEVSCTLKVYRLMRYFISQSEKVIPRDELLSKVWGDEYFGETRTLDMHVAEIRKILAANSSVAVITTVRGVGYILK